VVDHSRCEGKRDCVEVCPYDVFEVRTIDDADYRELSWFDRLKSTAHRWQTAYAVGAANCHACGLCVVACPESAIELAFG
jgi:NAD-dependent dihydropyrimidine dehydrogenase PreA subunit